MFSKMFSLIGIFSIFQPSFWGFSSFLTILSSVHNCSNLWSHWFFLYLSHILFGFIYFFNYFVISQNLPKSFISLVFPLFITHPFCIFFNFYRFLHPLIFASLFLRTWASVNICPNHQPH